MIRKDTGRKEKRNKVFLSIFLAVLMAASAFGIIVSNIGDSQTLTYKDTKIKQTSTGTFLAKVGGTEYSFDYFPTYIERIDLDPYVTELLNQSTQVIYTSDETSPAAQSISLAQFGLDQLFSKVNKPTFTGFTTKNAKNIPVATCADSTAQRPVIYFVITNQTIISTQGSCIVAEAQNAQDMIAVKDRIMYSYLGILP